MKPLQVAITLLSSKNGLLVHIILLLGEEISDHQLAAKFMANKLTHWLISPVQQA